MNPGATGIFGGTFNPIHLGHLRAAEDACEQLGLSRVLFVPSASPPHKASGSGERWIAPAERRSEWVAKAIAANSRFALSRVELERDGPSYTVDTLAELAAGDDRPVFLIGHDAFRELDTWHKPELLFERAHFGVLVRPPASREPLAAWLPKALHEAVAFDADGRGARHRAGSRIDVIEIAGVDVSSTELRRRLRTGSSIRYLVPENIREDIERTFPPTSPEPPVD